MEKKDEIRIPWGSGIVGYVAQSGEPVNIPDAYKVKTLWSNDLLLFIKKVNSIPPFILLIDRTVTCLLGWEI